MGLSGIKDFLVQKLLVGYLNKLLSKLPFNGLKTIVGVLLLVLQALIEAMPDYAVTFQMIVEVLKQLPNEAIGDLGLYAVVAGVVHKILKFFEKKQAPATPELVLVK